MASVLVYAVYDFTGVLPPVICLVSDVFRYPAGDVAGLTNVHVAAGPN